MKRTLAALFAVLCALALAGCAKKSDRLELNFMEVMTNPDRTALLHELIERYEQENTGVKINLISPPYEQADNRLTMSLNANQPLDIIEIRETFPPDSLV